MQKDEIKIVILAGGKGKRMQSDAPKALALYKGKPFLRHILDTIKQLGGNIKPIIVVGHKKEEVQNVFGNEYIYAEQREQLGTGHALMSAKAHAQSPHGIVIVLATDQPLISKETLETLIQKHTQEQPTLTMGTVTVSDFMDWRLGINNFGRIIRDTDGSIKKIVEFKDATEEEKNIKELNPALYAFDASWLWENIEKIRNQNAQQEYYLTDMIKMAFDQNKKIETISLANSIEALQPNSMEELALLEKLSI